MSTIPNKTQAAANEEKLGKHKGHECRWMTVLSLKCMKIKKYADTTQFFKSMIA